MIEILKRESALTIVEVLVAIILTAIVMLHGTLFFMASWRLSAESKDYSMILNDVVANLEKCMSMATDSADAAGNAPDNEYVVRNRTLTRNGKPITYTLKKQKMNYHQIYFVISSARWRYDYDATQDSDTIINIKSAYFYRFDNKINSDVWRT